MELKIKHLEMIQNIITKFNSNSFMLKGWAVTLIAGVFALASKDADKIYFLIAYIPTILFWSIDAYYLRQERLFRKLYKQVSKKSEKSIDFSMDISEFKGELDTLYLSCVLSITEILFYLPLALLTTGIIILTN